MTTHISTPSENKASSNRGGLVGGLILVGIGLAMLLAQVTDLGMYLTAFIGLVFLVAGMITRKSGLIVPGGIVGGVGLGILATQPGWLFPANSVESGGVFLLAFALGWFVVAVFSRLFTRETQDWAVIPGAVMAAIGGLILMGTDGLVILEWVGRLWPAALVIIGASMLIKYWKAPR